jgi:hypothetical protein
MRMPTRLHITWQDDRTLKLETDAGTQTRIFHFESSQAAGGDWQGVSVASWEYPRPPVYSSFGGLDFGFPPPPAPGRIAKSNDDQIETRIFAQEWRAVRKWHSHDRVFRSL